MGNTRAHAGLIAVLSALLLTVPAGAAPISFTFSGTFDTSGIGYVGGQPFSFTFLLNDYAPTTPAGYLTADSGGTGVVAWIDNAPGVPQVWANVTGTGLSGQWVPEVTSASQIALAVTAQGSGANASLTVAAHSGVGVLVNGNSHLVDLHFALVLDPYIVTLPGPAGTSIPPDPTDFFANFLGNYARDPVFTPFGRMVVVGESPLHFTADRVTISAVPESRVPEPGMSLLIASGCLLLVAARRKAVASSQSNPGGWLSAPGGHRTRRAEEQRSAGGSRQGVPATALAR